MLFQRGCGGAFLPQGSEQNAAVPAPHINYFLFCLHTSTSAYLSVKVLQVWQQLQHLLPVVGQPCQGVALKTGNLQLGKAGPLDPPRPAAVTLNPITCLHTAAVQTFDAHVHSLEPHAGWTAAPAVLQVDLTCRQGHAVSTSRQLISGSRLSAADRTRRRANCCTPCTYHTTALVKMQACMTVAGSIWCASVLYVCAFAAATMHAVLA